MMYIISYSVINQTDIHQFNSNNFDCQVETIQHSLSLRLIK